MLKRMVGLQNLEVSFWSPVYTCPWNLSHLLLSAAHCMLSLCVWQALVRVTTWCHGEVSWVPVLFVLQWGVLVWESVVSSRQPCTGNHPTTTMMQPLHEWVKEAHMWRDGGVLTWDGGTSCRKRHSRAVWVHCGHLLCGVQGQCSSRVICEWCHAHVGGAAKGFICGLWASLLAASNHHSALHHLGWGGWHSIAL
jgi:hypothetical protein